MFDTCFGYKIVSSYKPAIGDKLLYYRTNNTWSIWELQATRATRDFVTNGFFTAYKLSIVKTSDEKNYPIGYFRWLKEEDLEADFWKILPYQYNNIWYEVNGV